jgi:hypothetical protein
VFCHAELPLFAEPVLSAADVIGRAKALRYRRFSIIASLRLCGETKKITVF